MTLILSPKGELISLGCRGSGLRANTPDLTEG